MTKSIAGSYKLSDEAYGCFRDRRVLRIYPMEVRSFAAEGSTRCCHYHNVHG